MVQSGMSPVGNGMMVGRPGQSPAPGQGSLGNCCIRNELIFETNYLISLDNNIFNF